VRDLPRIGMFCSKAIDGDSLNEQVLAGVASFCGGFSLLPLPDGEVMIPPDVLVINDQHDSAARVVLGMSPSSFVLINSDRKSSYAPIRRYAGNLITYGINQKACLTASSIVDDELGGQLQLCIQRNFPTATGGVATVQEFPVHMHALGLDATIALVGVMLVCGANVQIIDEVFNFVKLA